MRIPESELILNPDGSIYHINLKPENLASKIILVGDPKRVSTVSNFFDQIEFKTEKREIVTHTGYYKGTHLTVISTGMGPDNIDIVLTELDAVANIDFEKRTIKEQFTPLSFVRMGTSGSFQGDIPVDHYVASHYAIGFDNLMHAYETPDNFFETALEDAFIAHTNWNIKMGRPYVLQTDLSFSNHFMGDKVHDGFTATAPGFYAPQGRKLRLRPAQPTLNDKITTFKYKDLRITNMEMETSAIYGLTKLMGHHACSMNCIIANRVTGTFSQDPYKAVQEMIAYTLDKMITL